MVNLDSTRGSYTASTDMLTANQAIAMINSGELSVQQYAQTCVENIKNAEPFVRALAYYDLDNLLKQAEISDRDKQVGLLSGIPIAIKDIVDVKDMPTGYGADAALHDMPNKDASCISLLKAAGALIVGKATTAEYAFSNPPPTRNPHNLNHTPGGSSSGSAAGVAAGMFPIAIGTQTGGSMIRPAAFCGVYGFKPTFNTVVRTGVKSFAESFDTIGWFGRSLEDISLTLQVLAPTIKTETHNKQLKIAMFKTPFWNLASSEMRDFMQKSAAKLQALEIDLPIDMQQVSNDHRLLMSVEMARSLRVEYISHSDKLSPSLIKLIQEGLKVSVNQELAAQNRLSKNRMIFDGVFDNYDLIIAPAAPGAAPAILENTGDSIFNRLWSAMHVPCLSMPLGFDAENMPLGLQVISKRFSDYALLESAKQVLRLI